MKGTVMPDVMIFVGTEQRDPAAYDPHAVRESLLGLLRILTTEHEVMLAFHEASIGVSVGASPDITSRLAIWIGPHISSERFTEGLQGKLDQVRVVESPLASLLGGEDAPRKAVFLGYDPELEDTAEQLLGAGVECIAVPKTGETASLLNQGICEVSDGKLRDLLSDEFARATAIARALMESL
jgi:hypothetical protein